MLFSCVAVCLLLFHVVIVDACLCDCFYVVVMGFRCCCVTCVSGVVSWVCAFVLCCVCLCVALFHVFVCTMLV